MLNNQEIAQLYDLVALLLEIKGENIFKIKTYAQTAEIIRSLPQELSVLLQDPSINIEGISKHQKENIQQILATNTFSTLEALKQEIPEGIIEMSQLPGLGPKKLKFLWQEAGITSLSQLETACKNGKILEYKGFGEKTRHSLLQEIQEYYQNNQKIHLDRAQRAANEVLQILATIAPISRYEISGELRRVLPTISKVLIVAEIFDKQEAEKKMLEKNFIIQNNNLLSYTTKEKVQVFVQLSHQFVTDLFSTSTYGEHYQKLEPYLSSALQSEEELYCKAKLPYIPPELRENKGELQLTSEEISQLLQPFHIKGIIHAHSTYSDGAHSLKEMALACQKLGYEYLGITDHSQSASYAKGLKIENLKLQWSEIDSLNQELAPFRILKGIEADILNNGDLDYEPEILAQFDFVIASVHSNLKMDEKTATQRLLKAIENPFTSILGHPTGRILLKRKGYPLDMPTIIEACAYHKVAIEINCDPYRLDLDWEWVNYAIEKEVKIVLSPDAHSTKAISNIQYGVLLGRKGFLKPEDTLNTFSANQILEYFNSKRSSVPLNS